MARIKARLTNAGAKRKIIGIFQFHIHKRALRGPVEVCVIELGDGLKVACADANRIGLEYGNSCTHDLSNGAVGDSCDPDVSSLIYGNGDTSVKEGRVLLKAGCR